MKVRAVFLDMDGTTLDNHHQISENTMQVLRYLSGRGVLICIATGRSTANLINYIHQLQLPQTQVPMICYNGGYGFLHQTGESKELEVVFGNPLSEFDSRQLVEFAIKNGCVPQYYNGLSGEVYAVPQTVEHEELLQRYAALVGNRQIYLDSYEAAYSKSLSAKILVMTNKADEILKEANATFGDRFTTIRGSPDPFFVEFLTRGVTKGDGVRLMCERLGLHLDETAAFGDGDNDAEMLRYVGYGCAMKNAKDPAKQAANVVIDWTNEEEGVAQQLQKMIDEDMFAFSDGSTV